MIRVLVKDEDYFVPVFGTLTGISGDVRCTMLGD